MMWIPLRSAKMYGFIFGFQRRVWWPKWTPASRSWRMETDATGATSCRFSSSANLVAGGRWALALPAPSRSERSACVLRAFSRGRLRWRLGVKPRTGRECSTGPVRCPSVLPAPECDAADADASSSHSTREPTMNAPSDPGGHKETIARFFSAIRDSDRAVLLEILTDEAVTRWPQSSERITGAMSCVRAYETYPGGPPSFRIERIRGSGDVWVAELVADYGTDRWYTVSIIEFDGPRIAGMTDYFGPSFEAPEWRRGIVDIEIAATQDARRHRSSHGVTVVAEAAAGLDRDQVEAERQARHGRSVG